LRRRWSDKQDRIDLFEREGKVGLKLKHDNIVEVIAVNKDPATNQYYIVMEFVEGGNLREILQIRKKLNVPEALRGIEDAADGVPPGRYHAVAGPAAPLPDAVAAAGSHPRRPPRRRGQERCQRQRRRAALALHRRARRASEGCVARQVQGGGLSRVPLQRA